jgi:ADP-heptose:LPS heptosyltransferase
MDTTLPDATFTKKLHSMKRILVVCTTGMGDALWGTPAIRALKKAYPSAGIDLLVQPAWKTLFDGNPHLENVYPYESRWSRQLALVIRLARRVYDCGLLFHVNKDFRRMIPLLRCPTFWAHQEFSWIDPEKTLSFTGEVHGIHRRLELLRQIGVPADGGAMEIFLNEDDRKNARDFLTQKGIGETTPYVYVNMGASLAHKRWSSKRFVELTRRILAESHHAVVLGGGPGEGGIIEEVRAHFPERVCAVYDRSLRANSALIEKAGLMVTTDTGPMHIGLALQTPMVALFGPTRPGESGPFEIDPSKCVVLRAMREGVPLCETRPADMNYFDPISIEEVWAKVASFICEQ